jgi:uncharacterized protein
MRRRRLLALALAFGVASPVALAGAHDDFFHAVEVDDADTVVSLLASGFDPNSPDERGQVGLFLALRGGAQKVAVALVANAATRVDAVNTFGETPLMMAALRGYLDWCQRLLQRGARINREGWAPLHYAASGPNPKVVAMLLDGGARVDAASPNRTTPLMMAARYGPEDAATLLISRGADAKLRNDKGLNAGDFARLGGRESLAEQLDRLAR